MLQTLEILRSAWRWWKKAPPIWHSTKALDASITNTIVCHRLAIEIAVSAKFTVKQLRHCKCTARQQWTAIDHSNTRHSVQNNHALVSE